MALRKKPVPVVLNPPKGTKFREETVLVSFTESQILVEVVGKTGRAKSTRYPRKSILDLNIANTEQINKIFSEDAPDKKVPKTKAPKNGRKKKTAGKKPGPKPKNGRKKKAAGKKPGPKKGSKRATKKTAEAPKNGRRKKPGPKPKKEAKAPKNGRKKKGAAPKKTAAPKKDSGTSIPPRRTKDSPSEAKDPWGDSWG
jgi:hypothetical protein